jgi:hypothetical protein
MPKIPMISIVQVDSTTLRAFGWVQDPSNFRSLCDVVAVFDRTSAQHHKLVNTTLPRLVREDDGVSDLIAAMNSTPLKIKYSHLVGTAFTPRSASRCNGIVQAAVKGQRRDFIVDWPADNFVRWAHCLGFIKYDYSDDTFSITSAGLKLTAAYSGTVELSEQERGLLMDALLAYPPAIRVLSLLAPENTHLTKFEIGRQLGFIGDGGFSSMPQSTLIRALTVIDDIRKKYDMRNNWEGSSDKYARMIASWLMKLNLVQQVGKRVTVEVGNDIYTETISQSFIITAQGLTALNRALGRSRHARIRKNVSYEMLATKGSDREYLRTRRALLIKLLSESRGAVAAEIAADYLALNNITASSNTIREDIIGLCNIGLDIEINNDSFTWKDAINDFIIPISAKITHSKSPIEQIKDEFRVNLAYISHDYLSLLDLAYDSKQHKLFEMKTLALLTDECGYLGAHLGGSRKPDGVIYTDTLSNNYGVIIDTKAYSKGYAIGQGDAMKRYVEENQRRDELENPNKWWTIFGDDVQTFYFMYISGHFNGHYKDQLERLSRITATHGAAVTVSELLITADKIKGKLYSYSDAQLVLFGCSL